MTDDATDSAPQPNPAPQSDVPESDMTLLSGERGTKSFWISVGIGSAGLAAALLYAKRPKRKT